MRLIRSILKLLFLPFKLTLKLFGFFPSGQERHKRFLQSKAWRKHHPAWLRLTLNRCTLYPWRRVGQVRGTYHPYAFHHANYGSNRFLWSVIPLSQEAHDYFIHGLLSGGKSAGEQKGYPNLPQRVVHAWCRLVLSIYLLIGFLNWILTPARAAAGLLKR